MAKIPKQSKVVGYDIENEAANLIKTEKASWEDALCFVTEKVAFRMRVLIRALRRNYWGIFEEPTDPVSGQKKVWPPLTESLCEAAVKNIDLDTKDINFRAKVAKAIGMTAVVRSTVKNYLDEINFGSKLNDLELKLAVDGTAVWKTIEVWDEAKKEKVCKIIPVDLLNFYIDPLASSIEETPAVFERALMTRDEFMSMDGWINKEKVSFSENQNINDERLTNIGGTKMAEIFERWGKMSKALMTGKEEDREELVEGHIVVSHASGAWVVHLIEDNKKGTKPYIEAWYTKVAGRWYGKGVAEKTMMLQLWMNMVVNMRINRARVAQLGIFKIKNNSGVTPQMLGRLASNGVITVNNMEDIQQMVVQDISMSSYKDEETIQGWAKKVTSAFEVVTGEQLPASTPATNAAIQSRAAQASFAMIKDGIGFFLQEWVKKHLYPILQKKFTKGYLARITGEPEELKEVDDYIVNYLLYKSVEDFTDKGITVDEDSLESERMRLEEELRKSDQRWVNLVESIDPFEYDVQVFVTNEEIDKSVLVNNLTSVLALVPEYKEVITKQIFDLMGLDSFQLKPPTNLMMQEAQPVPQQSNPTVQGQLTQAVTAQGG